MSNQNRWEFDLNIFISDSDTKVWKYENVVQIADWIVVIEESDLFRKWWRYCYRYIAEVPWHDARQLQFFQYSSSSWGLRNRMLESEEHSTYEGLVNVKTNFDLHNHNDLHSLHWRHHVEHLSRGELNSKWRDLVALPSCMVSWK